MRKLFDILIRPRSLLLLLLLVTLLKGWLWSMIVPILEASDEDQHYTYSQEVARQRSWTVSPPQQVPEEQSLLWSLVSPLRLSAQREPLDLSPTAREQIDAVLRRLDSPAAHTKLVPWSSAAYFIGQHPPLYYILEAVVYRLGMERTILVRMAWMRLLSVMIALGTVACTYGAARILWPDRTWFPLAVATLVSFHPYFTFFTSVINNAALEMLCFAGLIWLVAIIARRSMTWTRGLALGGVLAAGLLAKSSFVAAIPLVILLWGWDLLQAKGRLHWGGWLLAAALPLALAGWWYVDYVGSGGRAMAELYHASLGSAKAIPLLRYLRTYPWLTRYIPYLREWWGTFGWRDTPYPMAVYAGLEFLTLVAFLGWVLLGVRRRRTRPESGSRAARISGDGLALIIAAVCTLSLIAFYTALDYGMATYGGGFKIQGRYFLAPIAAQMMALAVGWAQFSRRWGLSIVCTAMIGLNTYTLAGVLVPRYYGEQIVVRHEPAGNPLLVAPNVVVGRDFTVEGEGLSRLDLWLKPIEGGAASEATLMLSREGQPVAEIPIPAQQRIAPYPAMLRFRALVGGSQPYTAQVRGAEVQVDLSQDGQLALKAYCRVPLGQIPQRISIMQPPGYSVSFLWILSGCYLLSVGLLVMACWILPARLVRPIPLPLDLEAP